MSAAAELPEEGLALGLEDPRGKGEPILFVHGFGHNRAVWRAVSHALPSRWRPIAVDLRGHGGSDWSPEGAYGLEDYARDLPAALDGLGVRRVHVVAHSLGGNVATLFAAAHPTRVRSLTLVDTGPSLASVGSAHVLGEVGDSLGSHESVEAWRRQLGRIHALAEPAWLDDFAAASLVERLDGRFELALDPGVMGPGVGGGEAAEEARAIAAIEARLWSALSALRCPVLVLRGGASAILSEEVAERMVSETLADGRLALIPGAGHAIMLDDPAGLRAQLVGFLEALPQDEPDPRSR